LSARQMNNSWFAHKFVSPRSPCLENYALGKSDFYSASAL
jgi:hypothetical protein